MEFNKYPPPPKKTKFLPGQKDLIYHQYLVSKTYNPCNKGGLNYSGHNGDRGEFAAYFWQLHGKI